MGTHLPSLDTTRISRAFDRGRERIRRTLNSHAEGESLGTEMYPALSAPLITLYVSAAVSEQSREAFDVLAESNIAFRIEASHNDAVFARFAEQDQYGLDGIRRLADALESARSILLDSDEVMADELSRRRDPALGKRADREREVYLQEAGCELERILDATASSTSQRVP